MALRPIGWAALVAAGAAVLWMGLGWVRGAGDEPGRAESPADAGPSQGDRAPGAEADTARGASPQSARADAGGALPTPSPGPVPLEPQDPAERTAALFDESVPQVLRETFERVAARRHIDPRDAVAVYDHGQSHPRDPRAPLVLGYDAMNRGWTEFGFEHYRNAHRADPEIRWDPRVMADLLEAAESTHHRDNALATMQEIYGSDGASDLARRSEDARGAGDHAVAELLRRVSETL